MFVFPDKIVFQFLTLENECSSSKNFFSTYKLEKVVLLVYAIGSLCTWQCLKGYWIGFCGVPLISLYLSLLLHV